MREIKPLRHGEGLQPMSKPTKSTGAALFDIGVEKPTDESARRIAYHPTPPDAPEPFIALLEKYASGCDVRDEVLAMIWPWDDPLKEMIRAALVAAEEYGQWKARNF